MNETPNDTGYQIATRIAAVAGVLVIVVCALLIYDYSRRLAKDPLDSTTYKAMLAALDQQPTNDALKEQIRVFDLQLRREYFRQRVFSEAGAGILLLFASIFLAAAKTAATLKRRLPTPTAHPAVADREAAWTRAARMGVATLGFVLMAVALTLALTTRSELHGLSQGGDTGRLAEDAKPLLPSETAAQASSDAQQANASPPRQADNAGKATDDVPPKAVSESPPASEDFAQMWPQFRGPDGSAISRYANVPDAWNGNTDEGIAWKTPVPLPGNNSPIVWGKRVFLSGADKAKREVYCFDAESGKLLWQQAVPGTPQSTTTPPKVNDDTGYAAATMATDGQRAFAIFANGDLAAFDFSGKLAWSKSLGMPDNIYGHASSLAIHKNLVLVQFDQGSARKSHSKFFAFDSATGKQVWEAERPVPNSWSSPIVVHSADRDQLITCADPWVIAYDPEKGGELWRAKCLKTDIGPSPAYADGRVFVANDNAELAALKTDGEGDITESGILWTGEDGMPDTCSPLATKDFVFLLTSFGTLTCYDAVKGDMLWAEDFNVDFSASPAMVENRLYMVDKSGKTWIVEPTRDKCNRMGEPELGEECVTSPAFQDGRIYLRGKDHLFCLGK